MWMKVLALVLAVATVFLSLLNGPLLYIRFFFEHDFFTHVVAFSALGFVVLGAWSAGWRTVALLFLFGVGIEVAQLLTPTRQFGLLDMTANLVGIGIGLLLIRVVRMRGPKPAEQEGRDA